MGKVHNLSGQRFGRLVAIEQSGYSNDGQAKWLCLCDCGGRAVIVAGHLRSGHTQSCGCLKGDSIRKLSVTHGSTNTRLYTIWTGIKQRCLNPVNPAFCDYGKRGVKICNEWKESFSNFQHWAYLNGYRDNLTIDRINVHGDYCPQNCRWITKSEQSNNRRTSRYIKYCGFKRTVKDWCDFLRIQRFPFDHAVQEHKDLTQVLQNQLARYEITDEQVISHFSQINTGYAG